MSNYTHTTITTHPKYSLIQSDVLEAMSSDNFDPEDGVFNIITNHLGHEPDFTLYEAFSMALELA